VSTPRRTARALALAAALVCPIACDRGAARHTLDAPRKVVDRLRPPVAPAQRHGPHAAGEAPPAAPLAWTTPAGWQQSHGNALRLASFLAPGGVDVSLVTLPAGGGGAQGNLDRWRQQMGLPGLTQAEFAALPRRTAAGRDDAIVLDVQGRYTGGEQPLEDARLLGLVGTLGTDGATAVFVKLVGPRAAVAAQQAAFDAFVASLRASDAPAAGSSSASLHGIEAPAVPLVETQGDEAAAGRLRWKVPAGFTRGDAAPLRIATYHPGGDREVHAYLVLLPGDAGGEAANFARWRGQIGLPPLGDAERAALARVHVLGREVPLLEAYGEHQGVLALGARVDGDSVFAKMTGPPAKLRAARDAFLALCGSLRVR
jgi:hypothetical protein